MLHQKPPHKLHTHAYSYLATTWYLWGLLTTSACFVILPYSSCKITLWFRRQKRRKSIQMSAKKRFFGLLPGSGKKSAKREPFVPLDAVERPVSEAVSAQHIRHKQIIFLYLFKSERDHPPPPLPSPNTLVVHTSNTRRVDRVQEQVTANPYTRH